MSDSKIDRNARLGLAISILDRSGQFEQDSVYHDAVKKHKNPVGLAEFITDLSEKNLLTDDLFLFGCSYECSDEYTLNGHEDAMFIALSLEIFMLHEYSLLNEHTLQLLKACQTTADTVKFTLTLNVLKRRDLLTPENYKRLVASLNAENGIAGFYKEAALLKKEQSEQYSIQLKKESVKFYLGLFCKNMPDSLSRDLKHRIIGIRDKIGAKCRLMLGAPSPENAAAFKVWFNQMILDEKKYFKLTPSLWKDTIYPMLMKLLSALTTLILLPLLPFSGGARRAFFGFFKEASVAVKMEEEFEKEAKRSEPDFLRLLSS